MRIVSLSSANIVADAVSLAHRISEFATVRFRVFPHGRSHLMSPTPSSIILRFKVRLARPVRKDPLGDRSSPESQVPEQQGNKRED